MVGARPGLRALMRRLRLGALPQEPWRGWEGARAGPHGPSSLCATGDDGPQAKALPSLRGGHHRHVCDTRVSPPDAVRRGKDPEVLPTRPAPRGPAVCLVRAPAGTVSTDPFGPSDMGSKHEAKA